MEAVSEAMHPVTLKRLLCVDDDPDVRTLIEIGLSSLMDTDVKICSSAREALSVLSGFSPDLIILDDQMPGMDGRSMAQALRDRRCGAGCPTIFLTAMAAHPGHAAEIASTGAIAVIGKPFDPLQLGAQILEIYSKFLAEQTGSDAPTKV